jgi:CheY-like chemotaxis protein
VSAWTGLAALAADDNEDSRKLAALILKREGMLVSQAEDGRQALDHVSTNAVELVLMDLEMPVLSGLEAIRAIRALQPVRAVKIVGLSAHADDSARQACLAAGADAYLVKPMRLADLQKVLAALFGTA